MSPEAILIIKSIAAGYLVLALLVFLWSMHKEMDEDRQNWRDALVTSFGRALGYPIGGVVLLFFGICYLLSQGLWVAF